MSTSSQPAKRLDDCFSFYKPPAEETTPESSGHQYFKIINGQKLCVASSDDSDKTIHILKPDAIVSMKKAMWELLRISDGTHRFKNRSTGKFIALDSAEVSITTGENGDDSKWIIKAMTSLSIDECKVIRADDDDAKESDSDEDAEPKKKQCFTNRNGKLVLEDVISQKTTKEVTEHATQLFKITYAKSGA
ncbi:hypothetical protein AGABI2DRAFT_194092 [Agaricus bisporus var. bisporus H97]|uniref:hypothetical protein n=1 Tax=Agaricus bisporus var. bisporus (strain H97 / ATCC MYA-4626 / FGSC 10389) TaxID=936046 RepID=UPI00029F718E|nr:hypothetical protein AGABI2DRAFT_194092 [Agaricus bisporus var. bisporus H97]EKV45041.1 hypothetical protein AGABI2DRAFT_194092 [Agaricus bisporus var. bisporus H97]